jgi:uncharacterized protein YigA (DUF484 family)
MTNPEAIVEFLQSNPDFLLEHPELIPIQSGNVVNFQQIMVNKLRTDKERSESRQRVIVDNARSNMTIQARVHAAVLRAIEARTWEELVDILASDVALMLQVDVITLVFEHTNDPNIIYPPTIQVVPNGTITSMLGSNDSLLQSNVVGDPKLFGPSARLVKSQAFLRLAVAPHVPEALIAFGSRDPLLFNDSQGTEIVSFLADAVERLIRRF